MRMKLRLNSMFAGHSYYPGAKHHSLSPPMVQQQYHPSGYSPRGSRPPSIEPLTHMRANSRDSLTTPSTDESLPFAMLFHFASEAAFNTPKSSFNSWKTRRRSG